MKKIFFSFFITISFQALLFSQLPRDWGAFTQRINAKPYQGKKFQLQAAVKVKLIDSTASGEIWARVDKEDKKMGFFYNMMDKPIQSGEWKIYMITGKIDEGAEWFNFGGLYNRKGLFYFDDFKLFIEGEKNEMKEMPIGEGGFEGDTSTIHKSWMFLQKRNGFNATATQNQAYSGKQCFLVDGSNFKALQPYGNNDSAGSYAEVNGIKMYYEIYGQGEPLILLHGNSESIISFNKQIPELSKYFKVIAIDSRGQGKSTEDGKKFTYDLFAADTKALLDYLKLDSVNILGWSDGGNIGLIMAINYPKKVKRLAVMGANLYNNNNSVKPWVNKELRKQYEEIKNDTLYKAPFRKRMLNLLMYEPNINEKDLEKISCPTLVMAGSDDVIKEAHTKLIAAGIKKSQLVIFAKGNHYEPSERPERFNKTVIDFLQSSK